jgi:hypothetical protein
MADALKEGKCQGIIERVRFDPRVPSIYHEAVLFSCLQKMHMEYLESLGETEGYPVQVVDHLTDGPLHLSAMLSDRNAQVRDAQATRKLSYWITHLVGTGMVNELYQYEVLRLQSTNKVSTRKRHHTF